MWLALLLLGCRHATAPAPSACGSIEVGPGPLSDAIHAERPIEAARQRLDEHEITGNPAYLAFAAVALDCAQTRSPSDPDVALLHGRLLLALDRYSDAEAAARAVIDHDVSWRSPMLLGDALVAVGRLDDAQAAYVHAERRHGGPSLESLERRGQIAWLQGDPTASALFRQALDLTGSDVDRARVLTHLGTIDAYAGGPGKDLDEALKIVPSYAPAHLVRGRMALAAHDALRARTELLLAGPTVEARRALAEADGDTLDAERAAVTAVRGEDERAYVEWLAFRDPAAAGTTVDAEFAARPDLETRAAHAYVHATAGDPIGADDARQAIASGLHEPRFLLFAGLALRDADLLGQAIASGPGLLPSERSAALAMLAELDGPR